MAANLMLTSDREQFEVGAIALYDPWSRTELVKILERAKIPVWYLGKPYLGFDPRTFVRLVRAMERFRPQVVHTHSSVLGYVLPYTLGRRIPAKVHTVHNLAEREVDWPGRLIHRVAFRRGVVPVAIAEEVADSLRRLYRIDGFPLIPNGIPLGAFRRPPIDRREWRRREGFAPTDLLFVCVAELRLQKNPTLLLEAFAQGPASDPRAHLLYVGAGRLRPDLERRIDALGLQEKVHLLGRRADVPGILHAADVFVLSSDWEGNPLSVMEAMAAGKPVICTAVGGVPELVGGGCGVLVPPRDAEGLAKAMRHVLENPGARTSMGMASAGRAVQRFDVGVMTESYEELYRTVLAGTRAVPKVG
jgi:glycosyltransferase involved in cell wall biosynthesis